MRRVILAALLWTALLTACMDAGTAIRVNWNLPLPAKAEQLYYADSGPSFHGDGVYYTVLEFPDGDGLEGLAAWNEPSADAAAEVETILAEITVAEEWKPDFSCCRYWYDRKADQSRVYVFYEEAEHVLYIVEDRF